MQQSWPMWNRSAICYCGNCYYQDADHDYEHGANHDDDYHDDDELDDAELDDDELDDGGNDDDDDDMYLAGFISSRCAPNQM